MAYQGSSKSYFRQLPNLSYPSLANDRSSVYDYQVVKNFFKRAKLSDLHTVLLEVRESNTVAQRLYKKYGFKKISKRKKYYVDEDAEVYLREKIYA